MTNSGSGWINRLLAQRRWFVALLLAVCVLGVVKQVVLWKNGPYPLYKDSAQYWSLGEQFAAGDWLLQDPPHLQRPVGYPAFLAVCQSLFGDQALAGAAAAQHLLVMLTSALVLWACWFLTQSRPLVLVAACLLLGCVSRSWFADNFIAETVFTFLLTAHVVAVLIWLKQPGWKLAALAGLLLGLSILVKPTSQWLWFVTLGGFVLAGWLGTVAKPLAYRGAAIGLLAMIVVAVPWVIRGQVVFGKPFISKSGGRSLWLSAYSSRGVGIGNDGAGLPIPWEHLEPEDRKRIEGLSDDVDRTHTWSVLGGLMANGASELEAESLMKRVATTGVRQHPGQFAASVVRRFFRFWVVTHVKDRGQARYDADATSGIDRVKQAYRFFAIHVQGILNGLLAIAVFASALILCWNRTTRVSGLILLGILLYVGLISSVGGQPIYRYRMVLEPIMILCLLHGVSVLGNRSRSVQREPIQAAA